ncbi:hypothetical protein [Limosilactobacillus coleohominis]|uniref:hypothetical protein n=1 Tax=Limosilactobacillus coleohominis TaxID=181675 RepID=UPI0005907EFB|nr:hypothetical protein [Limosilactobacillus coleohominis]
MVSQAQMNATRRYEKRHTEKNRLYQYRSNARTFIRKYASIDDLDALIAFAQEQKIINGNYLMVDGYRFNLPRPVSADSKSAHIAVSLYASGNLKNFRVGGLGLRNDKVITSVLVKLGN